MAYFSKILQTVNIIEVKKMLLFSWNKIEQISTEYAKLKQEHAELEQEHAKVKENYTKLEQDYAELERVKEDLVSRLNQNSSNSSRSPSSDGYRKVAKELSINNYSKLGLII
jgi:phage shock protein A